MKQRSPHRPQARVQTRGQALVEVAVFGSLVLMGLGALVRLGLNLTYRHAMTQESFRKAMSTAYFKKAHDASYTIVEDRLMPDAGSPLVLTPRSRMVSSSHVLWGRKLLGRTESIVRKSPKVIEVNFKAPDNTLPPYTWCPTSGGGPMNPNQPIKDYGDQLYSENENEKLGLTGSFEKDVIVSVNLTRSEGGGSASTNLNARQQETTTTHIKKARGARENVRQVLRKETNNAWSASLR